MQKETQQQNSPLLLLIEHEVSMVEYIRLGLLHEGFRVEVASFGREGLVMAEHSHPSVILIGMNFPA